MTDSTDLARLSARVVRLGAALRRTHNPLVQDPQLWEQFVAEVAWHERAAMAVTPASLIPLPGKPAGDETSRTARRLGADAARAGLPLSALIRARALVLDDIAAEILLGPAHRQDLRGRLVRLERLHASVAKADACSAEAHELHRRGLYEAELVVQRRSLARTVHDVIGNNVTLALRQLELASAEADQPRATEIRRPPRQRLPAAREALLEVLAASRALVNDLTPRVVVDDLEASLRRFAELAGTPGTRIELDVDPETQRLSMRHREQLFLVLREALRNVLTHTRAQRVRVVVDVDDQQVHALVEDDGPGLSAAEVSRTGTGRGLSFMRERVEGLGGRLLVNDRPGPAPGLRVMIRTPRNA